MLKQLTLYRIARDWEPNAHLFADSLDREEFAACGSTQALSAGWVPPRGEPGAPLLEVIDGNWLLSLRIEKRVLPGSVVREALEERLDQLETETGRRPGKRAQADLKDQVVLELLPRAFTTSSHVRVWINPQLRLLCVDAASIGKADEVITLLVKADPTLSPHLLQSAEAPAACMGAWLMDGLPPEHFVIDRDLELRAADEMKSTVRYGRHNLDTDEVRHHLTAGKMPKRMAMTWKERISFVLTDTMQIKGIKFLDVVFDGRDKPAKDEAFDVDAALATGELAQLIPDLIAAVGGELDFVGQSARIAAAHAPRPSGVAGVDQAVGGIGGLPDGRVSVRGEFVHVADRPPIDDERPVPALAGQGAEADVDATAGVGEGLFRHQKLRNDQKRSTEVCRHDSRDGAA